MRPVLARWIEVATIGDTARPKSVKLSSVSNLLSAAALLEEAAAAATTCANAKHRTFLYH